MAAHQLESQMMHRALELGLNARYSAHPNPAVGCVIARGDTIIGEGWTQAAGDDHAEIRALKAAARDGHSVQGADVYVTLEPCSHTGRTGPCADALIEAGVKRVVVAVQDPHEQVAGRGLARLSEAGIEVEVGLCADQARYQLRGFLSRQLRSRPWVRVKLAASLDGRTAMQSGESAWISSEESRRDVQFLRAESDCVLTGSGTVLQDNPSLDVRLSATELGLTGAVRQPLRAILDSRLRTRVDAGLFSVGGDIRLYTSDIKSNKYNSLDKNIKVVSQFGGPGGIDLPGLLQDLASVSVNFVHVEAGATLCGALMEAALVDEIVLYIAPHLMGNLGKPQFILPGIAKMQDRIELELAGLEQVGPDVRLQLLPASGFLNQPGIGSTDNRPSS